MKECVLEKEFPGAPRTRQRPQGGAGNATCWQTSRFGVVSSVRLFLVRHVQECVVSIDIFDLPTLFADLPPRTLGLAPFLVAAAMGMAREFECGLPDGSG